MEISEEDEVVDEVGDVEEHSLVRCFTQRRSVNHMVLQKISVLFLIIQ